MGRHTAFESAHFTSSRQRIIELLRFCSAFLAGIVTLLLLLRYACLPVLNYICPDIDLFDTGVYGAYPEEYYVSTDIRSPAANVVAWDASCDDGALVLMTLDGESVSNPGPMIVDMKGNLIWKSDDFGMSMNAKIQTYQGRDYITFWAGDKLQESGLGMYYMLDPSYEVAHTVSAVGDVRGDLHEFKITPEGSALITIYDRIRMDFEFYATETELGEDDVLVDGIFQEIDIATGKLLFEWRASDHLNEENIDYMGQSYGGYVADGAFDYFHINSVDKDSQGNFLVSLRHLHAIVYVSGSTHEIIWALGGNSEDFQDISDGEATYFSWQHDARWVSEEEGIISLFDNGMAHKHYDAPYSRGLLLQLNIHDRTVELLHEYTSLNDIGSASQGNVQILEKAQYKREPHIFIGWGASAAFTEHTLDGELLCETHLGASWLFYYERIKSYRASKTFGWKGDPSWDPEVQIQGDQIFVSWNGATEVADWVLQGKRRLQYEFEDVDTVSKGEAFESSFDLPDDEFVIYRVAALNAEGRVLKYSDGVVYEGTSGISQLMEVLAFVLSALLACAMAFRYWSLARSRFRKEAVEGYALIERCSEDEELTEIDRGPEDRKAFQHGLSSQQPAMHDSLVDS